MRSLCLWLLTCACAAAACIRDSRDLQAIRTTRARQPSGVSNHSWPLCSLIGPRNGIPGMYGTDLGFTARAEQEDKLAMLFGDTWMRPVEGCEYGPVKSDDLQAYLPRVRPAAFKPGAPGYEQPASCNLLDLPRENPDDPTSWPRIRLFPNPIARSEDAALDMSALRTPLTAFSDGERRYAVFFRDDPVYCATSSECIAGALCSTDDRYRGTKIGECKPAATSSDSTPVYCRTSDDCASTAHCEPAERGVCLAPKPFDLRLPQGRVVPTWYRDDPRRGIVHTLYVAAALWPERPADYGTVARFATNRFQNLTARAVAHFDPDRPDKNDYGPGHHTLLLWGRAAFLEVGGAQALPFFGFLPLSALRGDPEKVKWQPRYFAGYDDRGKPVWSENELDAQPIYGTEAKLVTVGGREKIAWREPEIDYVSQMSLSWVAPVRRWVMLYGGDLPAFPLLRSSGRAREPVHLPFGPGAIHMRASPHPWGSARWGAADGGWSSPEPVLTRNAAARYLACGDGGPSGLPGCLPKGDPDKPLELFTALAGLSVRDPGKFASVAGKCIAGEVVRAAQGQLSGDEIGRLYGVNIIDEWTEVVEGGRAAEIYWNVSTWNPYQVILVKTRLGARPR